MFPLYPHMNSEYMKKHSFSTKSFHEFQQLRSLEKASTKQAKAKAEADGGAWAGFYKRLGHIVHQLLNICLNAVPCSWCDGVYGAIFASQFAFALTQEGAHIPEFLQQSRLYRLALSWALSCVGCLTCWEAMSSKAIDVICVPQQKRPVSNDLSPLGFNPHSWPPAARRMPGYGGREPELDGLAHMVSKGAGILVPKQCYSLSNSGTIHPLFSTMATLGFKFKCVSRLLKPFQLHRCDFSLVHGSYCQLQWPLVWNGKPVSAWRTLKMNW